MAHRRLRQIGRFLQKLVLAFFILMVIAVGLTWYFQDKIVALIVAEANEYLLTPVHPKKITFSILEDFPRVSVVFHEVTVEESIPGSHAPLLEAARIYCGLSMWDLIQGDIIIDRIELSDGFIHLRKSPGGTINYRVIDDKAASSQGNKKFLLEHVVLSDMDLWYEDPVKSYLIKSAISDMHLRLMGDTTTLHATLSGKWVQEQVKIDADEFFTGKPFSGGAAFSMNYASREIRFEPSQINVAGAPFALSGTIAQEPSVVLDLQVDGKGTDIRTLSSFLPERIRKDLAPYRSEGFIYFNAQVKGLVDRSTNPGILVNFGCKDASFYHPDYKERITGLQLSGEFGNGTQKSMATAYLRLQDVEGQLDGHPFSGSLEIGNFREYPLSLSLETAQDLPTVLRLFPQENILRSRGTVSITLNLKGKWKPAGKQNPAVEASGQLGLRQVDLLIKNSPVAFTELEGDFLFNNQDLAISHLSGYAGNSDFELSGLFKNIITYLARPNQPIKVEAKLKSRELYMEELLSGAMAESGTAASTGSYRFDISPQLDLRIACEVGYVEFKRFRGKKIAGRLEVKNQQAFLDDIRMDIAGGHLDLSTRIDASLPNDLRFSTQASMEGIHVDSLFYIFHDFNQDWLQSRHLRGRIDADLGLRYALTKELVLYRDQLKGAITLQIKGGELNDFEPMQRLAKYIDGESLKKLRFSDLSNEVLIDNQTITLPYMSVRSNVSTIRVSGTHTFDQRIDYHIEVPLINKQRVDSDATYGAIRDDGTGKSHLLLRILGTIDEYEVLLDKAAVREKVKQGVKNEKEELKQIFQQKGQPLDTQELEDDDYFEWDDDGGS